MTDARDDAPEETEQVAPAEERPEPAERGTADAASAPAAQRRDGTGEMTA
jgi:hypothetical protein